MFYVFSSQMSEWKIFLLFFFSCEGQFKRLQYFLIFSCKISLLRTKKTVHSKKQTSLQSLNAFHPLWLQPVSPTSTRTSSRKIFFTHLILWVFTVARRSSLQWFRISRGSSAQTMSVQVPQGSTRTKSIPIITQKHTPRHSRTLYPPKNKLHPLFTRRHKRWQATESEAFPANRSGSTLKVFSNFLLHFWRFPRFSTCTTSLTVK